MNTATPVHPGQHVWWDYRPMNYQKAHYDHIGRVVRVEKSTAHIEVRRRDGRIRRRWVKLDRIRAAR